MTDAPSAPPPPVQSPADGPVAGPGGAVAPSTPVVAVHDASVFDEPLTAEQGALARRGPQHLYYNGATVAQIADELCAQHDLGTPDGWVGALTSLAARPEVFRHLVAVLVQGPTHDDWKWALKYVTENGVGKPLERIEHRGTVGVVVVSPPIRWTDDEVSAPARPALGAGSPVSGASE